MGTNTGNERRVVDSIKNGDKKAAKELYDTYSGYLTGIVARYVADDDLLKDVLQESFVKIFSSIDTFEYKGEGSLKAWLAKIVVNESLRQIVENKKNQAIEISDVIEDNPEYDPELVEEDDVDKIPIDVLKEMICNLPDGYRIVFNLYVIEGRSHKEISSMLGIKENSSASQLHRAKAILSEQIAIYLNKKFKN